MNDRNKRINAAVEKKNKRAKPHDTIIVIHCACDCGGRRKTQQLCNVRDKLNLIDMKEQNCTELKFELRWTSHQPQSNKKMIAQTIPKTKWDEREDEIETTTTWTWKTEQTEWITKRSDEDERNKKTQTTTSNNNEDQMRTRTSEEPVIPTKIIMNPSMCPKMMK